MYDERDFKWYINVFFPKIWLIGPKGDFKNYKKLFMEQLEKLILKGDLNDHEVRVYGEIWGKKWSRKISCKVMFEKYLTSQYQLMKLE